MMTEKIAHLRALLIDDGWDVERRADALKALAEIEAAWGALLAPVEVEREADAFRLRWLGSGTWCPWSEVVESGQAEEWRRAVRPLVEDRARFAREVAGLRGIVRAANGLAGKARAEIARLTAEIDRLMVALAERTTERDILGRWYSGARAEVIERCEEIRRLTAAPGEAGEAARVAMIHAMNGASLAHAALSDAWSRYDQTPRTAAPGEAWERLRERAKALAEDAEAITGAAHLSKVHTDMLAELRAALAAVEPRVHAVTADPSAPRILALRRTLTGLRGFVDAVGRALIDDALVADNGAANGLPADWAITHDFRPGAQDGMPRLADVEAREFIASAPGQSGPLCVDCSTDPETQHTHTEARPTGRCASCGNGGIMYAPPEWTAPPAGVTEAELAEAAAPVPGATRPCVAVLATNAAGEVLLVLSGKREGRHHDRGWELPGGKLDPGEDPRDGARREAIEETGLAVVLSEDEPTVLPPSARHRGALLFRARAEGQPRPGSDAIGVGWWTPTAVLELHARGLLSDLASRAVLVEWAQNASACNVDHSPDERPRVLGGECAECLHRPPLHEPTCTKARCSHTPAASPPDRRAALAAAEHAYLVGAGWIHHPEGRIPSGPEDGWTWEEGVWEDVTDPDRNTIAGGPSRWDHEHALREQLRRDGHPRGRRGAAARTWSEEQIREAWYRAQETGRPGHERPREADDLANGWEHVRAALHGKAV